MLVLLLLLCLGLPVWGQPIPAAQRSGGWQAVLQRCQANSRRRLEQAQAWGARVQPTPDGSSFFLSYSPPKAKANAPIVVSLHGHESWAADEATMWKDELDRRGWRLLALQWWFGNGQGLENYLRPHEMYPAIESALSGTPARGAILHGFSMGSANSYALAGLDRDTGNNFFGLCIANAGSAESDYPPTAGVRSLAGTHWVLYAGVKDWQNPEKSGPEAMSRTANWLKSKGAMVDLFIKDPEGDHGGFHLRPQNMRAALDFYRN